MSAITYNKVTGEKIYVTLYTPKWRVIHKGLFDNRGQEMAGFVAEQDDAMLYENGQNGYTAIMKFLKDFKLDLKYKVFDSVKDQTKFIQSNNYPFAAEVSTYAVPQAYNASDIQFWAKLDFLGSGANAGKIVYSAIGLNGRNWKIVAGNLPLGKADVQEVTINGLVQQAAQFGHPMPMDGFGSLIDVLQTTVLGTDSTLIGYGCAAIKRVNKTLFERINVPPDLTPPTHTSVTADPRYDALVLYRTLTGPRDFALLVVKGAELAVPVKVADAVIETAVDAVVLGAAWVRLADIKITEVGVAPVLIVAADIEYEVKTTYTLHTTALPLLGEYDKDFFSDAYIPFGWRGYDTADSWQKDNKGWSCASGTTVTFVGNVRFFECCYNVATPFTFL
jgi:hypothetical protein